MIYVPNLDFECYVIKNKDTIRAYETNSIQSGSVNYVDYYVNSHYMQQQGTETLETSPICIQTETLTNDWYYRNDIADIFFIIVTIFTFCILLPLAVYSRMFKRFR